MSIASIWLGVEAADRLVVAVADQEVVLDDAPERRQRQDVRDDRLAVLARDREHEPLLDQRQLQPVGPVAVSPTGRKLFSSTRSKIATARSCSTSGVERPIDSSSSTSISLAWSALARPASPPTG